MDPFIGIKLELAVVVLVDVAVLLLFAGVDLPEWQELSGLLLIGLGSACWLVWRTGRLKQRLRARVEEENGQN